ncbi:hypothetical protein H5410_007715 [Solanum commersonii]|uniref:Uncharacterized protein n=1 Tax=Solanum commersonii TaxID=4109 RepID=A0A9J6ADI4_SOLCO|nr:hypothetical protein H5410_007715 [Solanum commersonii]
MLLLDPQHSFEVEFVQDIMQQENDNHDCEMFFVVFVEFLSGEIKSHLMIFEVTIFAQDIQHCYESMVLTRPRRNMLARMMILQGRRVTTLHQ